MGSSPVTATIPLPPPPALARVVAALAESLEGRTAVGDRIVVAFSGGPDSCALLAAAARIAVARKVEIVAAHLDHGLDEGSASRAAQARETARTLGIAWVGDRTTVVAGRQGLEAAAREARYAFLDRVRRERGAGWILTGHHRDDQIETVLLRILLGSAWPGLAGMRAVRGHVLRPLLDLSRETLAAATAEAGLVPTIDPTNDDPRRPRNRIRHRLATTLAGAGEPTLGLARRAAAAAARVERELLAAVPPETIGGRPAVSLARARRLPAALLPFLAARLHRDAGLPYPPRAVAVAELARRLRSAEPIDVAAGGGHRWRGRDDCLVLVGPPPAKAAPFAYTLGVPGECELPAVRARFRLAREPVASWMWRGEERRAAMSLPLTEGDVVTIRNRRPGDRLHPLGSGGRRRLKEVLIDHKMPRERRDVLPLLCVGDRIAWVPGVTVEDAFRLRPGAATAWVATLGEPDP